MSRWLYSVTVSRSERSNSVIRRGLKRRSDSVGLTLLTVAVGVLYKCIFCTISVGKLQCVLCCIILSVLANE